jgi:predicted membrane protein
MEKKDKKKLFYDILGILPILFFIISINFQNVGFITLFGMLAVLCMVIFHLYMLSYMWKSRDIIEFIICFIIPFFSLLYYWGTQRWRFSDNYEDEQRKIAERKTKKKIKEENERKRKREQKKKEEKRLSKRKDDDY